MITIDISYILDISQQDQNAMQLGRLLMSTVFDQEEVTTTDSVSRFFLDNWLAKNGSDSRSADTLSLDLMCTLQRALGEHKYNRSVSHLEENDKDISEDKFDDFSYPTPAAQNIVTAVALEAFDRLIEEFGNANPVLKDIREALLPSIYTSMTERPQNTSEKESHEEKTSECNLSSPLTFNPSQNNILDTASTIDSSSVVQHLVEDITENQPRKPHGQSYTNFCTWRENVDVVRSEIIPTQIALRKEIRKTKALELSSFNLLNENEKMQKETGELIQQVFEEKNKTNLIIIERKKFEEMHKSLSLIHQAYVAEQIELSTKRDKEDAKILIDRNIFQSTIKELEYSLRKARLKVDDVSMILLARDQAIKELEKSGAELKSKVSELR